MRFFLLLAVGVALCAPAMATEEPTHSVLERHGAIEIREYTAHILAEVTVQGDRRQASGRGFRPLANYIFGGNQPRQEIAMTAPVASQRAGQQIAMTTPVTTEAARDGEWTVAFVMPRQWTMDSLPQPNDARVTLREQPARRVAVIRFSGVMGGRRTDAKLADLQAFLTERGLQARSTPVFAAYDPPWVPGPLRRNEIWIEIAGDSS